MRIQTLEYIHKLLIEQAAIEKATYDLAAETFNRVKEEKAQNKELLQQQGEAVSEAYHAKNKAAQVLNEFECEKW